MAKKEKKLQKALEKALRKGDFDEMVDILKRYGGGKSVHEEFETFDEDDVEENTNSEKGKGKKDKKETKEPKKEKAAVDKFGFPKVVMRPAIVDYKAVLEEIDKEERRELKLKDKCKAIAKKQLEKILEANPMIEEEDIDLDELTDTIYDELYLNGKKKKEQKSA